MVSVAGMSERNLLLDNCKGVLIFLVVFGHSLELYKEENIIFSIIYMFIYLFHMPVFVFISGYFSKDLEKCRKNAFTTFLIPFIIFNVLWNGIAALFTGNFSLFSFITPGWALWYLISMFFWRVFLKDLLRVRYIVPLSFIIGLGAGVFSEFGAMLSLSRTLVFFPFFLMGYLTTEEKLLHFKKHTKLISCAIVIGTLCFAIGVSYYQLFPVETLYMSDSFKEVTVPIWLGLIGRSVIYITGFGFIFVFANSLTSKETFLSKIGRNTLPVYILHTYLLCILFAINYFISSPIIQFLICIIGSGMITYSLSRNVVTRYFNGAMNRGIRFLMKPH